jgi:hypothetical protein
VLQTINEARRSQEGVIVTKSVQWPGRRRAQTGALLLEFLRREPLPATRFIDNVRPSPVGRVEVRTAPIALGHHAVIRQPCDMDRPACPSPR